MTDAPAASLPDHAYAANVAIIKELELRIGRDAVLAGLGSFRRRHAHGQATKDDLVECWSEGSGQDLREWSAARMQAPGQLLPDKQLPGRGACEVVVDPRADGPCCAFRGSAAGVDLIGDVSAEPAAKFDLFLDVAPSPGRAGADAAAPQVVRAVEHEEMNVADPPAAGSFPQMPGDERS